MTADYKRASAGFAGGGLDHGSVISSYRRSVTTLTQAVQGLDHRVERADGYVLGARRG